MEIDFVISHIRDRPYMSGVERSEQRIIERQEVFTTSDLAIEGLANLDESYFKDPEQDFVDPCCGDGTLLGEALIRKCQNGIEFETALITMKGCDIEPSNVEATRNRLLCGREDLRPIVEKNIIVCDALEDDLLFGNKRIFGHGLFSIEP